MSLNEDRIVLRTTAGGGDRFAIVLDFDILPRLAPRKKFMEESGLNFLGRSPSGRQMIPPGANAPSGQEERCKHLAFLPE
jgi:hypothetical protein